MTRFARAKGSKASNERLPESPTSWYEMKEGLLNKSKELDEKKNRDKVMEQRERNYQAFLQEKEEEDDKKISWAAFSESRKAVEKQKTPNISKKHKLDFENDNKKRTRSLESSFKTERVKNVKTFVQQNGDAESDDSMEEFSTLRSKIDKVLSIQKTHDSDTDTPPEEVSTKEKPQEIIIKKFKKPKQKLQILIDHKNKRNNINQDANKDLQKKAKDSEIKKRNLKEENLSDKDKRMIEKKQERYKKQLEKKKLKKQEKKFKKSEIMDDDKTSTDVISSVMKKGFTVLNSSEIDPKKLEKKLERRKKRKERKLKKRQEAGLINIVEAKRKDEVLTEKDLAKIQKKKERRARQAEKRKKFKEAKYTQKNEKEKYEETVNKNDGPDDLGKNVTDKVHGDNKFQNKLSRNEGNNEQTQDFMERKPYQKHLDNQKRKKTKLKDNKNFQRNKGKQEIMFINGKTIEIDYVDGFPVKKEDADRLKKLRKEMISKGLPRSEINIALKLERRRAEKALAREKKNVCFNCRKSGHNLSECPELGKDQVAQTSGTGICFKCGSTEHTHFECKVVKGLDYRFATCFICKEQGHISRQCPDNQRGLYPKGGACKVCGDVTHLKKDCPKYQTQQAQLQSSIGIETLDNGNPDDLDSKWESKNSSGPVKRLNKIKF